MILNLIFFILSCIVLIISGTYLVKSLSTIAKFLRLSEFSAAFIIMAIATSIPELFVGISSAFSNTPALSLGNVIGACIIDLTLMIGIFVLIGKGIKIKNGKLGKDIYYVLMAILLVGILYLIGNQISRIDGIILILFFIGNSIRIFRKREKYRKKYKPETKIKKLAAILIFLIAIILLFLASEYVVRYSKSLAIDFGLSELFVGLFLLSIATTLPEFIFGIKAMQAGKKEMALGDQTGTVLTNLTLIVGLVALISPITTPLIPFIISISFLFISAFIFITFLKSEQTLHVGEGVALILLYIFFIVLQYFIKIK